MIKIAIEIWARGLGMFIAGFWWLLLAALMATGALMFKRKFKLAAVVFACAVFVAPVVQFWTFESKTREVAAWLGDWRGSFGGAAAHLHFESNRGATITGRMLDGPCAVGLELVTLVDGTKVVIMSADLVVVASLSGDSTHLSGTVSGCGQEDLRVELTKE